MDLNPSTDNLYCMNEKYFFFKQYFETCDIWLKFCMKQL